MDDLIAYFEPQRPVALSAYYLLKICRFLQEILFCKITISILEFEGTLQRTDFDVQLILFDCSIKKNLSQVSA